MRPSVWQSCQEQEVVRVQVLDVVSAAQRKSLVPGGGSALIGLHHYTEWVGFESPSDRKRPVCRTVVDDDDLLRLPRLRNRRAKSLGNPGLCVVRGNED